MLELDTHPARHSPTLRSVQLPADSAPDGRRAATRQLLHELAAESDAAAVRRLRQQIVELNMPVANDVAGRYRGRGIPIEDLRQVAYEGLVKAVAHYDVNEGAELLSYAVPTMRGEIRRYFRDRGWMIRPPRRIQENQARIERCHAQLVQELGREPTRAELSERLGISRHDLDETQQAYGCFTPASLDRPLADDAHATLADLLSSDYSDHETSEIRLVLGPAIAGLSGRDREVLRLRFFEDLRQKEIGERIGITQMQVSRVLTRILATLRESVA